MVQPRYEVQTSATNRRIRELISAITKKELSPRPDFQRRLVWTNADKVKFLETVLEALPFPEIYVSAGEVDPNTAESTEWLVDGQQRVSTLYEYFIGAPQLRLPATITPYKQLTQADQLRFLDYQVVVRDLGNVPIAYVKTVFERINSTKYGLNAMELANARYDGEIKKTAEELAKSPFYSDHNVFNAADIRRMADVSFQLNLLITLEGGYFDDTADHEVYLERYNDEYPHKALYSQRLQAVFTVLNNAKLAVKVRWWKKADLFSLIVELDRVLQKRTISPMDLKRELAHLSTLIERHEHHDMSLSDADNKRAGTYSFAAAQGSNHRKNRIARGEILASLLASI